MEPISFEALLGLWRRAAVGFFGHTKGALHLTKDQREPLDAAAPTKRGSQAGPYYFIVFDDDGMPLRADYEPPDEDYYLIEVPVTTGLYQAPSTRRPTAVD